MAGPLLRAPASTAVTPAVTVDPAAWPSPTSTPAPSGIVSRRFWWWPWPRAGQRVPYPAAWRKSADALGREDPAQYAGCGLWWLSWVAVGGDPVHFVPGFNGDPRDIAQPPLTQPPSDHAAALLPEPDSEETGPFAADAVSIASSIDNDDEGEAPAAHVGSLGPGAAPPTAFARLARRWPLVLLAGLLWPACVLVPNLWAWLVYGAVPLGDPAACGLRAAAVSVFVTRPLLALTQLA